MALICIAPPLLEPVSLTELKEMLRLSPNDNSQDNVLAGLNIAARTWCEALSRRKFVQQTWRLGMDFFPGYIDSKLVGQSISSPFVSGANAVLVGIRYAVVLPFSPVQSLIDFQYQDANGDLTTMMTTPPSFVMDLDSQPARLTPNFGSMWPVARVVINSVLIDFQCGFAVPVTVSASTTSPALTGATFTAANVGRMISIPGAGVNGGTLNTIIASVDGEGNGSVRDIPQAAVSNVSALLAAFGTPGYFEVAKLGIKFLVSSWFVNRVPSYDAATRDCVKAILSPIRDLRV